VIKRKQKFLDVYKTNGTVNLSCECLGIEVATFKRWMKDDINFAHNFNRISKETDKE